jgi:predicted HicB family RNase H-like nuclease
MAGKKSGETGAQLLVRMPPDLHQAIKDRAAQEDRTMAQTIRQAMRFYLRRAPAA